MANPLLLLSGIGMMLVGLIPLIYWWRSRRIPWKYFAWGGGLWALAIGVKLVLDLTVTPGFQSILRGLYPAFGVAIVTGVYVGLRTGLLESGFSYLAILKTKLREMKWNEAVAFSLGFGCTEAFIIGLFGFINLYVLLFYPQAVQALPEGIKAIIIQQLELPTLAILPAIMERVFVVLIHLFASLLVVYSVITRKFKYFIYSMVFKTILDGMLPLILSYIGTETLLSIYLIELPIMLLGLIGFLGFFWMKGKFKNPEKGEANPKRDIGLLVAVSAIICIAGLLLAGLGMSAPEEGKAIELEGLGGKYDFIANGEYIGYSDYQITGKTGYKGQDAWHMSESTSLSAEGLDLDITGSLYITEKAEPLYYETNLTLNNETTLLKLEFSPENIRETIERDNVSQELDINPLKNTYLITNNMIGQWALIFKSLELEEGKTYTVNMFNPNTAMPIVGTLTITGKESITIQGREYQAFLITGDMGQKNYVTPEGLLLKIESPGLEIVLSQ